MPDNGDRAAAGYAEEADGMMAGIDEMEIAVTGAVMGLDIEAVQQTALGSALGVIRGGGVLASSMASSGLVSDFDPLYFVKTHPVSFPHGTGAVPVGMGLATYARILVERSIGRPDAEGGEDVMLVLTMFNILQRHQALSASRARIRGSPEDFRKLDAMTNDDFGRLYRACVVGEWGSVGSFSGSFGYSRRALRLAFESTIGADDEWCAPRIASCRNAGQGLATGHRGVRRPTACVYPPACRARIVGQRRRNAGSDGVLSQ